MRQWRTRHFVALRRLQGQEWIKPCRPVHPKWGVQTWFWHIIGLPSGDWAAPLFPEHGDPGSRTPTRGGACAQRPFITDPPCE
jgi:hypothetical protein